MEQWGSADAARLTDWAELERAREVVRFEAWKAVREHTLVHGTGLGEQ